MTLVDIANGKQRHVPYRDSKLTFLLQVIVPYSKSILPRIRVSMDTRVEMIVASFLDPIPSLNYLIASLQCIGFSWRQFKDHHNCHREPCQLVIDKLSGTSL